MVDDINENQNKLDKLEKLIAILLDLLETHIENGNINENQDFLKSIIGKNESIVSAICKLGNILLKINLDKTKSHNNQDCSSNIEEIDLELLKDYLNNMQK